jgi:hypothetical protein
MARAAQGRGEIIMSKPLGKQTNIVPTVLGPMAVSTEYVSEYDVEDIVRTKAESQARIIQMMNVARDIKSTANTTGVLPTIYTDITEDLEE